MSRELWSGLAALVLLRERAVDITKGHLNSYYILQVLLRRRLLLFLLLLVLTLTLLVVLQLVPVVALVLVVACRNLLLVFLVEHSHY